MVMRNRTVRLRAFGPGHCAVVAGIELNGLGVLRALGRARIPVIGIDTDINQPSAATRFGRKVRVAALSGAAFIEELMALRSRLHSDPVLLLTQEASVATISANRELLRGAYRISLPPQDVVEALLDKLRFQVLAERLGFPIPRLARLREDPDAAALDELRFPCVLKPTKKTPRYSERFVKAYKVATAKHALKLWTEMRAVVDEVVVQEWIEGNDSDVYFCLQYRPAGGAPSISFAGRKTCQWPPLVGGTASCIPAPEVAPELTAMTDRFFAAAGCVGMCSMEYKRDSRDGSFYLVEPTVGRTDYQEEISTLNGVNIPAAAYFTELGLEFPGPHAITRMRGWRDPDGCANARAAGAPDLLSALAPHATAADAYFRADDPMPHLVLKLRAVRNRFKRLFRMAHGTAAPCSPG